MTCILLEDAIQTFSMSGELSWFQFVRFNSSYISLIFKRIFKKNKKDKIQKTLDQPHKNPDYPNQTIVRSNCSFFISVLNLNKSFGPNSRIKNAF
ncbi:hypothetical protein BpHYR1_016958 [Brachionus plicatilis]|uniref:Uncharacterized protein n=1 Tax=Brachionus plicatilis TaxID=10195 RepID=A0A3M7SSC6_BRAPC|nr:hypothetical protein BpHYR1_016958 [Brachionus plicatilis]